MIQRLAACVCVLAALGAVPAALAGEPGPLRDHAMRPTVESPGDSLRPAAVPARGRPAGVDSLVARRIESAARVRLLLQDGMRYEGAAARLDPTGLRFDDPALRGLHFGWQDVGTVDVSLGDKRWLGAAAGGIIAFTAAFLLARPDAEESEVLSSGALEGLRFATMSVSGAIGALIGFEIGRSTQDWEQVHP